MGSKNCFKRWMSWKNRFHQSSKLKLSSGLDISRSQFVCPKFPISSAYLACIWEGHVFHVQNSYGLCCVLNEGAETIKRSPPSPIRLTSQSICQPGWGQSKFELKSMSMCLEPVCPLFWELNPPKRKPLFQSKQGAQFGFQVTIPLVEPSDINSKKGCFGYTPWN